jgi:hypothetical protein
MFKNISSGGVFTAVALLIIAGICALLGFRDKATGTAGSGALLWCAIGFIVFALIVAAADARRHTLRLKREAAQRANNPLGH